MSLNSLTVNLKLKKWFIVLLKVSALLKSRKLFNWIFYNFWKKGSKVTMGGGK